MTETPRLEPDPAAVTHTTEVIDFHVELLHAVRPITAVGEVSVAPKFVPTTARVAMPAVGPFVPIDAVISGAEYEYALARVLDADASVITMLRDWPDPMGEMQTDAVADTHDEVPQEVKPKRSDAE